MLVLESGSLMMSRHVVSDGELTRVTLLMVGQSMGGVSTVNYGDEGGIDLMSGDYYWGL